jgi:hypothetical protein
MKYPFVCQLFYILNRLVSHVNRDMFIMLTSIGKQTNFHSLWWHLRTLIYEIGPLCRRKSWKVQLSSFLRTSRWRLFSLSSTIWINFGSSYIYMGVDNWLVWSSQSRLLYPLRFVSTIQAKSFQYNFSILWGKKSVTNHWSFL